MTTAPIKENEPLKPLTTFKVGGPARYFAEAATENEFRDALQFARRQHLPIFILGGGSNILVSDRGFHGVVIHPRLKGLENATEADGTVVINIKAGEIWDDVVRQSVEQELWSIENLSHIPGQAGAALVQNIGAYGEQISDVFRSAEVMDTASGAVRTVGPADCGLDYRRSIFNTSAKGKFIILSLRLALRRRRAPHLEYPGVKAWFDERAVAQPSIQEIREAIIQIRDRKFPFPREEKGGNAGSFFKNLLLSEAEFEALRVNLRRHGPASDLKRLEEIRGRSPREPIKVPTAFLIEICGLKGYRVGGAQVNEAQPLVLLNEGGATAEDVLSLAGHVRWTVRSRTGVTISIEPELVGFSEKEIEKHLGTVGATRP